MQKKKNVACMEILVRFIVKRKDGTIKFDSGRKPSKCMVLQFLRVIAANFKGASISVKDVAGASHTIVTTGWGVGGNGFRQLMGLNAASDHDEYGIVAGRGTAAEANDDYKLETQCAQGAGANQLLHGSMGFTEATIEAGNVDYVMERAFTNGSGAGITVEEVGVYCRVWGTDMSVYYFCVLRDLTGGIALANGEVLTIEYTWRTTV